MYYLTKEWYLSGKDGSLCCGYTPADEARTYSEEYFQKLYAESEQKYLDSEHKIFLESQSSEFDPEAAKVRHRERFLGKLENIKQEFPPELLGMIADPRVYALGYAAPEIIEEATAYCEACNRIRHETIMASWAQQKLRFAGREPDFLKDFHFHDHHIKTGRFIGDSFVLEPEPAAIESMLDRREHGGTVGPGGHTYVFRNAEILRQDAPLENVFGIYDEIFPTESGYEFHLLLGQKPHDHEDYFELVLHCSDLMILKPRYPDRYLNVSKYRILIETFIPGWKSDHRLKEYMDVETPYRPWVWVKLNGRFPICEQTTTPDGDPKIITRNDDGISVHYTFTQA